MKKIVLSLFLLLTSLLEAHSAVVFDFGSVMTGPSKREIVSDFLKKSFKLSDEQLQTLQQERRKAYVESGMSDVDFWRSYAASRKIKLSKKWVCSLKEAMKSAVNVNPLMYELVEELKCNGIEVALLSNVDERLATLLDEMGYYAPFDPCILSYQEGCEKPGSAIYEILLQRLALPASEVLFIDDRIENVEAARRLGIDAILFESAERTREELARRSLLK